MDDREKLMERYDDAAFALMMDEYAEAEGEAILAEFRAAAEAGELPEMPEELDKACRNTIRREYARRERRVRLRQLRRAAARVAVAVFAVIGILSTIVMSVEAWREPFFGLIMQDKGNFLQILQKTPDNDIQETTDNGVQRNKIHIAAETIFGKMIPREYGIITDTITENVTILTYGAGEEDEYILQLYISPAGGEVQLDTEEAACTMIMLGDYDALLIEEPPGCMVFWENQEYGVYFTVQGTLHDGFTKDMMLEMCEALSRLE